MVTDERGKRDQKRACGIWENTLADWMGDIGENGDTINSGMKEVWGLLMMLVAGVGLKWWVWSLQVGGGPNLGRKAGAIEIGWRTGEQLMNKYVRTATRPTDNITDFVTDNSKYTQRHPHSDVLYYDCPLSSSTTVQSSTIRSGDVLEPTFQIPTVQYSNIFSWPHLVNIYLKKATDGMLQDVADGTPRVQHR